MSIFFQFKIDVQKKEEDGFWKEESSTPATCDETVNFNIVNALDNSSHNTIHSDRSSFHPGQAPPSVGKRSRWQLLVSLLKPNLNQPVRQASNKSVCNTDGCGNVNECALSSNDDCKPKITRLDMPLPCVLTKKPPPPCKIPKQKQWCCCDRSMCLPCCCPIEKPLKCKIFDITLNTCPRKTYRIAAYSECNKRYGRKQKKKECCYYKRICYAGPIADREIKPLIHIKDRQALTLGFGIKALCDTMPKC